MFMREADFRAAIIANQDDDGPRLICADWLDEQGLPERAEFIRVQCQLNRARYGSGIWKRLRKRPGELLGTPAGTRFRPECAYGFPCAIHWERGFIQRVRCSLQDWAVRGAAFLLWEPVEELILTDLTAFETVMKLPLESLLKPPLRSIRLVAALDFLFIPDHMNAFENWCLANAPVEIEYATYYDVDPRR